MTRRDVNRRDGLPGDLRVLNERVPQAELGSWAPPERNPYDWWLYRFAGEVRATDNGRVLRTRRER